MHLQDIGTLLRRVARLSQSLEVKSGEGAEWKYTFPDGETHTYRLKNFRPPEEIEDDAFHLILWTWSLKDYLRELALDRGRPTNFVEQVVKKDPHLPLCADLANLLKHGKLTSSRTGRYPRLRRCHFELPGKAVNEVTVGPFLVELNIARPQLVEISLPVEDRRGKPMGDALEHSRKGVERWEQVYRELKAPS
jgi:hypothetical protein